MRSSPGRPNARPPQHHRGPRPADESTVHPDLSLEPLGGFEDIRAEWTELAERSGNLFSTWEWAYSWWRHFGDDRPLHLLGARRPDRSLAVILPLYEASPRPLRVARFVGHGPADQLGPVAAPDDQRAGAQALLRVLNVRGPRWDLLLADRLPGDQGWSQATGAKVVRRESSPVVRIRGMSWEEFLTARSSNFRQQVRRRERKLMREHGLSFRLSDDPERLPEDFDALLTLHDARWGAASGAFAPRRRALHREFAALALERGWLRLWLAEAGGRTIAAWYGFRFGGTEWYYQAGRHPEWAGSSVGFVLLAHTIREAFEDGMREYRLLLGGEPYKDRFATDDPGLETLALAGTRAGRAAQAGDALIGRLPGRASRLTGRLIDRGTRR